MSVTATENSATYSFARTLADYDLHHSDEFEDTSPVPNERSTPEGTGDNPEDWDDSFRRVPDFRPIDRELDFAFRDTYSNNFERAFLWNMFNGIRIVSGTNRLWRATGGRINDRIFRWDLGGEY